MDEKELISQAAKLLGKKGGDATLKKYGKRHLKRQGKLGGRPRKNPPQEKQPNIEN